VRCDQHYVEDVDYGILVYFNQAGRQTASPQ